MRFRKPMRNFLAAVASNGLAQPTEAGHEADHANKKILGTVPTREPDRPRKNRATERRHERSQKKFSKGGRFRVDGGGNRPFAKNRSFPVKADTATYALRE